MTFIFSDDRKWLSCRARLGIGEEHDFRNGKREFGIDVAAITGDLVEVLHAVNVFGENGWIRREINCENYPRRLMARLLFARGNIGRAALWVREGMECVRRKTNESREVLAREVLSIAFAVDHRTTLAEAASAR
jgi:hypothetical protein